MAAKLFSIAAVALALLLATGAHAQVATGQSGVCCAFILDASNNPVLVCNNPANVRRQTLSRARARTAACICMHGPGPNPRARRSTVASLHRLPPLTGPLPCTTRAHATQIPGAQPFPAGTVISGQFVVPGQIAQCVGRFRYPNPSPYKLPANGIQWFSPPNNRKCAGQFSRFYQGLGPDGGFVVQVGAALLAGACLSAKGCAARPGWVQPGVAHCTKRMSALASCLIS